MESQAHKSFKKPKAGPSAEKKKASNLKKKGVMPEERARNPKAFAFNNPVAVARELRKKLDIESKRLHMPKVDRTTLDPPPRVVAIVGPPKVGKTTLIKSLVKHFSHQKITEVKGPATVVTGKKQRLTLVECPNDLTAMLDVAKIADVAVLLIDASFGFEMETFEFLNILQTHGFPKILGVLTHLDKFKTDKSLRKLKKKMKSRFWTEVYKGATLFSLSGLVGDAYHKLEITNLGRFLTVSALRPLAWQNSHPYTLVDRVEDITDPDQIRSNPSCDRSVSFYGFLRGSNLKPHMMVHIPGSGDYRMASLTPLPDPCPHPHKAKAEKKRIRLDERDRMLYAPMSDFNDIIYDKDAMYVNIPDEKINFSDVAGGPKPSQGVGERMVRDLQNTKFAIDEKMAEGSFDIFSSSVQSNGTRQIEKVQGEDGRTRRRVLFNGNDTDGGDDDGDSVVDGDDTEVDADMSFDGNNTADVDSDYDNGESLQFDDADAGSDEDSEYVMPRDIKKESIDDDDEILDDDDIAEAVAHLRWKDSMHKHAVSVIKRGTNLADIIYGSSDSSVNDVDTSKFVPTSDSLHDFSNDQTIRAVLLSRFVASDEIVGDEQYGDFEDLETGKRYTAKPSDGIDEVEKNRREKESLKSKFNKEYDDQKEEGAAKGAVEGAREALFKEEPTFAGEMRKQMEEQKARNRAEFAEDDVATRAQYEGLTAGVYVRIVIEKIPCEFVQHFSPLYPVVVGGLLASEEAVGMVQVRIKKHRWHPKILKNGDPLIISLGWRRFQTIPTYSIRDVNGRNRMLKYTPEHMHCIATFYGPITPPNTGLIAFKHLDKDVPTFRVSATGVVLELDKSSSIVKKLKLIGEPSKIFQKTAIIKGMFTSALEVAKFIGASLRTVSGLRGQIKKADKEVEGAFRATFEDKIYSHDIVFLRAWYPVEPVKYYNPVSSHHIADRSQWQNQLGMKTIRQIRAEKGIPIPMKSDSNYQNHVTREAYKQKNELKIPKRISAALPFSQRPAKKRKVLDEAKDRVAVVVEEKDQKIAKLMHQLKTITQYKNNKIEAKRKAEKAEFLMKKEQQQAEVDAKRKKIRKIDHIKQGLLQKKRAGNFKTKLNLDATK